MAPSFHRRPHVLAVPLPFQGHIHPLMAICKKLISAGFMVTFANTHANHQRITGQRKERRGEEWDDEEGDGLRMVSLGEDVPVECDNLVDTIVEMFKPGMRGAVARLLRRLKEEQDGVPVTLLAFDFRLCFVLDLAIAAGIPSLSLWTQNAANFACNLLLHRGFQPPPGMNATATTTKAAAAADGDGGGKAEQMKVLGGDEEDGIDCLPRGDVLVSHNNNGAGADNGFDVLMAPHAIVAQNNEFYLMMQGDCNLVLYNRAKYPLWSSRSKGRGSKCSLSLLRDGNLVISNENGKRVWASGSSISCPSVFLLIMQNDGNLVIYDMLSGLPIWATGTNQ